MIDARELFQCSSSKLDKYILISLTISCIKLDYDTSHARYKVYVQVKDYRILLCVDR